MPPPTEPIWLRLVRVRHPRLPESALFPHITERNGPNRIGGFVWSDGSPCERGQIGFARSKHPRPPIWLRFVGEVPPIGLLGKSPVQVFSRPRFWTGATGSVFPTLCGGRWVPAAWGRKYRTHGTPGGFVRRYSLVPRELVEASSLASPNRSFPRKSKPSRSVASFGRLRGGFARRGWASVADSSGSPCHGRLVKERSGIRSPFDRASSHK
jgi:hypothetical protein